VIDVLEQEASSGFPHLAGARVSGTVRLRQDVLNAGLQRVREVPAGLGLDVSGGNRIAVHYGLVRVTGVIDENVDVSGGVPRVRIELASALVALGLRAVLRGPLMVIEGRNLIVDLAALDAVAQQRRYWALLRKVRLRTMPGLVLVDLEAAV
jgi:hypothetical protein